MRVLLLSFYYPPDIGPGPLRAKSIVDGLLEVAADQVHIDVLTTLPNRYHTFSSTAPGIETTQSVSIQRIALPSHRSGTEDQAKAFMVFAGNVAKATRRKEWDVVVATSSRLMTAALGAWVANRAGAKLYLDIRDLFVDTMGDVLSSSVLRVLLPSFAFLEQRVFRSADRLNVVSAGFLPHVKHIASDASPTVYTNGIDEDFIADECSIGSTNSAPLVVYAGNMGDGQGLHHVVPAAAVLLRGSVHFRLIGDGGRKKDMEAQLSISQSNNVELLAPVPRLELIGHYREADVLFLHLNDFQAFRKVLPSKIFEYAATGKPILAGVAGYAAEFLRTEVPGVEIFEPCDANGMVSALHRLLDGPKMIDRTAFCAKYSRRAIMRQMVADILSMN